MFIAITMCCIIPVWFGWVISGLMALEKNRDACLAFGLSITSIIVFLIMFMPKSRQLAAMGRDGMYIEDGEEKFSTISRVVSPSFFHLKPVKPVHHTSSKHQASVINPFAGKSIFSLATDHFFFSFTMAVLFLLHLFPALLFFNLQIELHWLPLHRLMLITTIRVVILQHRMQMVNNFFKLVLISGGSYKGI